VPADNIHLLSLTPELRTLLHWRDLFFELRVASICSLYRKARATFAELPASLSTSRVTAYSL
jgi:hypothetical protein